MAVLRFTLSEEGVSALREALSCLSRFSDEVSLEAKREKVGVALIWNASYIKLEDADRKLLERSSY
jgi:cell cycle checkpoint control protein RAD9A